MHLWVQPVDETVSEASNNDEIPVVDSESSRPIVQLDVHVTHYLRKKLVSDPTSVFKSLKPCEYFGDMCFASLTRIRDTPLDDFSFWTESRAD